MKRYLQLVLLLAPLVCLLGCQSAQEALPDLLPKDGPVERLYLTHTLAGESHSQVLEGDACRELVAWIAQLDFQPVAFAQGASPGDAEGGEVYDIALEQGGASCFSYVITGDAAFFWRMGPGMPSRIPPRPPQTASRRNEPGLGAVA